MHSNTGKRSQAPLAIAALYFLLLFALAFPAVKVQAGMEIRVGQVLLVAFFVVIFFRDLHYRTAEWVVLLCMMWVGLVFWSVSSLSEYPKIKEHVFVVKQLVLYPAGVYLGLRMVYLTPVKLQLTVIERVLGLACLVGVMLHTYPVGALIHERPAHLSIHLKGSFWEQGELAFFVGLFLVTSLTLRLEHGIWPKRRTYLGMLYCLAIGCSLWSMNKTIWISLCVVLLSLGMNARTIDYIQSRLKRQHLFAGIKGRTIVWYCVSTGAAMIVFVVSFNVCLPEGEKLFSRGMLIHKWESERGAALEAAVQAILQSPWIGTGLGSMAGYFVPRHPEIVGIGPETGQLFNSLLDLWLSVGILGPIFLIVLLRVCFSRYSFPSVVIPPYLLCWMMLNPIAQSEYFYLLLGLSLGYARLARVALRTRITDDLTTARMEVGKMGDAVKWPRKSSPSRDSRRDKI